MDLASGKSRGWNMFFLDFEESHQSSHGGLPARLVGLHVDLWGYDGN